MNKLSGTPVRVIAEVHTAKARYFLVQAHQAERMGLNKKAAFFGRLAAANLSLAILYDTIALGKQVS